jgi:uncharacterized protein YegJ (DUF2314 family)
MFYAFLAPASAQAPPPLSPDARFAFALFCAPTCSDEVIDTLDAGLSSIKARDGFPDEARRPMRIMGMAGADFGVPDATFVELYGTGVDRPEALAASQEVLLAWVASPREEAVETLAVAHRAFADAARVGGGWVEDLDTQRLYGAAAWAALDPRGPVTDWFIIDADATTAESSRLRLVTRGLRRYGDFELVVEDVHPDAAGDVSFVVNAIATRLRAEDGVPVVLPLSTKEVRGSASFLAISRLQTDPEEPLLKVTFEGEITVPVTTVPTVAPAVAPPQAVAEVAPPVAPMARSRATDAGEPTAPVATDAGTAPPTATPSTAPVATPPPPAPPPTAATPPTARTLEEAQQSARRRFAEIVVPTWLRGLPTGDAVAVKVPFKTPTGDAEYMWVELRRIDGMELGGVLMNEPYDVSGLQKGDVVTLRMDEIFDYVWKKADGTREGNTTAPFLK